MTPSLVRLRLIHDGLVLRVPSLCKSSSNAVPIRHTLNLVYCRKSLALTWNIFSKVLVGQDTESHDAEVQGSRNSNNC